MPTAEWERGFAAGYNAAVATQAKTFDERFMPKATSKPKAKKVTRTGSAYSKKYGKAFKKVAPRYKKKNGSWKKDGFKRAQKAAHKEAKKGSTKKGQRRKTARRAYEK